MRFAVRNFLPLIAFAALFLLPAITRADKSHKPPPISLVLYLESQGPAGEPSAPLLDLRDRLRSNNRLEVLVFEPDSPTFILAAKSANPPIDLDTVNTADTRLALAQAAGAQFAVMAAPTDVASQNSDIRVFELWPVSRSWTFANKGAKDAAKAIADQVIAAAADRTASSALPTAPSGQAPTQTVVPPISSAPAASAGQGAAPVKPASPPSPVSTPTSPPPAIQAPPSSTQAPPAVQAPSSSQQPAISQPATPTPAPVTGASNPPASVPSASNPPAPEPSAVNSTAPKPAPRSSKSKGQSPKQASKGVIPEGEAVVVAPSPIPAPSTPTPSSPVNPPSGTASPANTPPATSTQPTPQSASTPATAPSPASSAPPALPPQSAPSTPAIQPPSQPSPLPPAADSTPVPSSAVQNAPPLAVEPPRTTQPDTIATNPQHGRKGGQKGGGRKPAPVEVPLITESPLRAPAEGPSLDQVAQGKIAQGDLALQQSDVYGAIEFYREAVNDAPRATQPRMKLIQAYIQAGLKDQALDEERRALMLDPNNQDIQNLLKQQSADGSLPGADLAVREADVARNPDDESGWISLGDSYWNSGQPDQALQAYLKAAHLAPGDVSAQAHLARLYAATSQYDKSLDALAKAGSAGYPFALRIIAARTDSLVADLESAHDSFAKGNTTREEFYDSVKKSDGQAQQLASFVAKITPPDAYKVAYLHRRLATNLLAQATAEWLNFIETNDGQYSDQATLLQSEAAQEMKTASIAERLQSSVSAVSH